MSWDMDRDVMMVFQDAEGKSFEPNKFDTYCNVIILSYNRPRMLREAIDSVLSQSHKNFKIYILDDGSNFGVNKLIEEYKEDRIIAYLFEPMTLKDRVNKSRVASNINLVSSIMKKGELVFYLCDDDLMAPNWMTMAVQTLSDRPDIHLVQGETWTFNDGQDYLKDSVVGMPYAEEAGIRFELPVLWWSSGSFVHRTDCFIDEGLRWHDNSDGHSQDAQFILDLWKLHPNLCMINKPSYYRREHKNTLSARLGKFNEDGTWKQGFKIPAVEEHMVEGMME